MRAVKIDVLAEERNFFIVFIFSGAYTREDEIKAKALAQKMNSQFFHDYNCQSYIARYDLKEPIPTIGRAVYLANEEMLEDEDTATLFYESVIDALAGKINQDLCAVKAEVDEFKKKAFFWFYYDSEPTEQHRLTAQAVADLSCPTGYTKILEVEHLTPYDKIPAIGRYIYRRFDL